MFKHYFLKIKPHLSFFYYGSAFFILSQFSYVYSKVRNHLQSQFQTLMNIFSIQQTFSQTTEKLFSKGLKLFNNGDFMESLAYFKKVLEIIDDEPSMNNKVFHSQCHYLIARIYQAMNKQDEAIEKFETALKTLPATPNGDSVLLADIYHWIGVSYASNFNYYLAKTNFLKALNVKIELLGERAVSQTYRELSALYSTLENYPKAFNFIEKAINTMKNEILDKKVLAELCYLYASDTIRLLHKTEFFILTKANRLEPIILQLVEKSGTQVKEETLSIYLHNLGNFSIARGNRNEGFINLKNSLLLMKLYYGRTHPKVQELYKEIYGSYIMYMGDPTEIINIMKN